MFKGNKQPDGTRSRYGVVASNYDASDSSFDLQLTFLEGETYCCVEPGCHFGFFDDRWFGKLATALSDLGWFGTPPTRMRNGQATIESGAAFTVPPRVESESWSYQLGMEHHGEGP